MAEYVAGKGTTALGIIGTALGGLAAAGGNLLNMNGAPCCENTPASRYEMNMQRELSQKEAEIAYLKGQNETDGKIVEAYTRLESRINALSDKMQANKDEQYGINLQQAVYNGTNTATISCIQSQVAALQALTKTVVPNSSVCPGWGNVTVAPATTPAAG